jgi:NAD(P)H-flavin reductase
VNTTIFSGRAAVSAIRREPRGYLDIDIACPNVAIRGGPGQFVMLRPPLLNDPLVPRPFDIVSTSPVAGTFRLIIKIVGRATGLLESLREGDGLDITGPLGAPITDYACSSLALLVRGCGAAAVLAFLAEAKKRKIAVHTVLSAASADRFILRRELEELSDSLLLVTDDGSAGEQALGSAVLKRLVQRTPVDRIYSCGGGPFYLPDLKELDADKKAPVWLFLESYMACGFGYCHGCAVKKSGGGYSLVCKDGPLYKLSEIEEPCPIYQ